MVTKKKVEDIMPIATGHEREELEAELEVSFCYKNSLYVDLILRIELMICILIE